MSGPTASAGSASSYQAATDILSDRDPVLRRLVAQGGPFQVDPPTETPFAALVRAILYQQLAGAAARAIHGRLIASVGGEVTPERLLSLPPETLRTVGLSANKAASMRDLATKVLDGSVVLDPAMLRGLGDDEVVVMLSGVRGIGAWTAQHTPEAVMEMLQGAGVPSGAVHRLGDLFTDPQLAHRRIWRDLSHAELGRFHYEAPPFTLSETPADLRPSPLLGEHNTHVYRDVLGLAEPDIARLIARGVIE